MFTLNFYGNHAKTTTKKIKYIKYITSTKFDKTEIKDCFSSCHSAVKYIYYVPDLLWYDSIGLINHLLMHLSNDATHQVIHSMLAGLVFKTRLLYMYCLKGNVLSSLFTFGWRGSSYFYVSTLFYCGVFTNILVRRWPIFKKSTLRVWKCRQYVIKF